MSKRYTSNFIAGGNPQVPTLSSNNGIFDIRDAYTATSNNVWQEPDGYYEIPRSLRFRSSNNNTLSWTPNIVASGGQKTFTWSGWVKRSGSLGSLQAIVTVQSGSYEDSFAFVGTDAIRFYFSGQSTGLVTNMLFRDVSAWYHIVVAVDTSESQTSNRVKLWVNGVEQSFSGTEYPSQNSTSYWCGQYTHHIGRYANQSQPTGQFEGYMAELNLIDGQALDPSYFGYFDPVTNIWQPKKYTGIYGNNGYYLPFTEPQATTNAGPVNLGRNFAGSNYIRYSYAGTVGNGYAIERATNTVNAVVAPDGSTTGNTLTVDTTASNTHRFYIQTPSNPAAGTSQTASIYLKYNNARYVNIENWNGSAAATSTIDLLTGQLGYGIGAGVAANTTIQNVGNGWYRVSVPLSAGNNGSGTPSVALYINDSSGNNVWTGNGTSAVHWWGTQINTGVTPDPHVITNGTAGLKDFAVNNFSLTAGTTFDLMSDSPTNVVGHFLNNASADIGGVVSGNYATLNSLYRGFNLQWTNGNLSVNNTTTESTHRICSSTIGMTSGKWYWEVAVNNSANVDILGVISDDFIPDSYVGGSGASAGWGYNTSSGAYYPGATWSSSGTAPAFPSSGNIAVAFDADTKKMWFGTISGGSITWNTAAGGVGNPAAGTNATFTYTGTQTTFFPAVSIYYNTGSWGFNFGQRPFLATPPSGFRSLNTANIQSLGTSITGNIATAAYTPYKFFTATTYGGNNAHRNVINGVNAPSGFKPDLLWIKSRSSVINHVLNDSARGVGMDLYPNLANVEASTAGITAFNSDGFSLAPDGGGGTNGNGLHYVAWQWAIPSSLKSNTTATPVTNTSGTYTSTVLANQDLGFSIVQWTGNGSSSSQSVGHGLSRSPHFIIIKKRNKSEFWYVGHYGSGYGFNYAYHNFLNGTSAVVGSNDPYYMGTQNGGSDPFIYLSPGTGTNGATESGINYIAYCWHDVPGFSKFGQWRNNGGNDGQFVYTGFRPAFILMKNTDNVERWFIQDSARTPYNSAPGSTNATQYLVPNDTSAEGTNGANNSGIDFLSNGFKIRSTNTGAGEVSFGTRYYMYAAFAESPFVLNNRAR